MRFLASFSFRGMISILHWLGGTADGPLRWAVVWRYWWFRWALMWIYS